MNEEINRLKKENIELKVKLKVAIKALIDIRDWNDEIEEKYDDQGYRAIEALLTINKT